jgi:hypothetical protein
MGCIMHLVLERISLNSKPCRSAVANCSVVEGVYVWVREWCAGEAGVQVCVLAVQQDGDGAWVSGLLAPGGAQGNVWSFAAQGAAAEAKHVLLVSLHCMDSFHDAAQVYCLHLWRDS